MSRSACAARGGRGRGRGACGVRGSENLVSLSYFKLAGKGEAHARINKHTRKTQRETHLWTSAWSCAGVWRSGGTCGARAWR